MSAERSSKPKAGISRASITFRSPTSLTMRSEEKVKGYLFKGGEEDSKTAGETALIHFKDRLGLFHDVMSSQYEWSGLCGHPVVGDDGAETEWIKLRSCALRAALRDGVRIIRLSCRPIPVFLHDLIGCVSFRDRHRADGWEQAHSDRCDRRVPGGQVFLGFLQLWTHCRFEYRWNTRAVLLDPEEAKRSSPMP